MSKKSKKKKKDNLSGSATVARNRKASFDFHLGKEFVAGIVLQGTEVKSVRNGQVQLKNAKAKLNAAFVPAFLGVGMVLTGMIGGAVYKVANLKLANTVFDEGVLVYVCYGVVLSGIGAVAYFGPRIWGREIASAPVLGLGLLGFLATVLASLPYFIAGLS